VDYRVNKYMKTISLSMIVKNEENHLATALESVKGIDEIVICDTGSIDNTVELAKKYTDKVFTDYVWADDFAEARNHVLEKCTSDWILIVDADERLESNVSDLYQEIEKAEKLNAITINVNVISERNSNVHKQPRLFKRCEKNFWRGAIHNTLSTTAQMESPLVIRYGYSDAHKLDPDRALRILSKEVEKNPDCSREKYYLAREYWYRKDYQTAYDWYEQYLSKPTWNPERADAYLMAAKCLWNIQRGEEARKMCLNAININPDFKEALLFMAEMHYDPNKSKWLKMANVAENKDVLFVRT